MIPWIAIMASLSIVGLPRVPTNPEAGVPVLTAAQQASSAIDRWLSHPTRIVLTEDQQLRLDSVRVKYAAERKVVSQAVKTEGEMAVVLKMQALDAKYQKLVRALLTPEQQVVFDKNIQSGLPGAHP